MSEGEGRDVQRFGMDTALKVTPEQVELVKRQVFPDAASEDELKLFLYNCQRLGVHPLDKMVHPVVRAGQKGRTVSFQASIDLMRAKAESSGEYGGQDPAEFDDEDAEYPSWCQKTIYKIINGTRVPFTVKVRWKEFYPGEKMGFMWKQKPYHMLEKVAEAQAIRKAFPEALAGFYAAEELQSATDEAGAEESVGMAESVQEAEYEDVPPPGAAGPSAAQENAHSIILPNKALDAKAQIRQLLAYLSGMDQETGKELLKEVSSFEGSGGTRWAASVEKLSEAWAKSTLGRLEKMIPEGPRNPLPDACVQNPTQCYATEIHDGTAMCLERSSVPCPFGAGIS